MTYDHPDNKRGEPLKPAIIHVADYSAPYGGNFIRSLCELDARCENLGWRQVLVLPKSAAEKEWCLSLRAMGRSLHFLEDSISLPEFARSICRLVLGEGGSLIHTHFSRFDVGSWAAQGMLRVRGKSIQLVWHAHSDLGDDYSLKRRAKNYVKYHAMGKSVFMIPVSDHVRSQLVTAGFSPQRLRVVPNGIDVSRAIARAHKPSEVRDACGIPEGVPLLLLFGWDPERKGVDTALIAIRGLIAEGRKVILGLVGEGVLHSFVRHWSGDALPPWVRLMPPIEHVADYYQVATVFLSPSRQEGLPYSVCEAMVNGVPVALSDIPTQAFAHASQGAVFFPPGDAPRLQDILRTLLDWSPEDRMKAAGQNQLLIRDTYNVIDWAKQIATIYQELLL